MPSWLIPVILVDLVFTTLALWIVFRARARAQGRGPDFHGLAEFTNAVHPRIGEYVRSNWSGMPDQLPGVLRPLLDEIERESRSRALPLDRDTLKLLLARSLASHRIGRGSDVRLALERVA